MVPLKMPAGLEGRELYAPEIWRASTFQTIFEFANFSHDPITIFRSTKVASTVQMAPYAAVNKLNPTQTDGISSCPASLGKNARRAQRPMQQQPKHRRSCSNLSPGYLPELHHAPTHL